MLFVLLNCLFPFRSIPAVISRLSFIIMNVLPERSPPINEVVQSGVVPRFVEFLARDDFPQLQVWFVTRVIYFGTEFHVCYSCLLILFFYGLGCCLV